MALLLSIHLSIIVLGEELCQWLVCSGYSSVTVDEEDQQQQQGQWAADTDYLQAEMEHCLTGHVALWLLILILKSGSQGEVYVHITCWSK